MLEHHGYSLLRVGGVHGFTAWRAAATEVVLPKRAPDGLLEVFFPDQPRPDLFLLEIETYPEREHERQVLDDLTLVPAARGVLPDVISLILRPRGQFRLTGRQEVTSQHGCSRIEFNWKVIELWTLAATDLLAANDVGLIPLVPLTHWDGEPAALIEECKQRIEQQAPLQEQENLLVVTQVMTRLAYNDTSLLSLLMRGRTMIESPIFAEWRVQAKHDAIHKVLESRCGSVPPAIAAKLQTVMDEEQVDELIGAAASCPDLEAFQAKLGTNHD
jgi:hypothetical protein